MLTVAREFRKLKAIYWMYTQEAFAYPAVSVIWVLVDCFHGILLPAVWIAAMKSGQTIGGLTPGGITAYYLVSMTLSQFITCHLLWDIAWEIKQGTFSSHIVRPITYFRASVARNFSFRVTKLILFLPIGALVFVIYSGIVQFPALHFHWTFFAATVLAHVLSFLAAYCLALVTFWTVEFWSVFEIFYTVEMFLSGRLFPIGFMPDWIESVAKYLHFRYTNAFPVDLLLGRYPGEEIAFGFLMQVVWICFFACLARFLFDRGTKRYTGAGM